jgi:hypothetical protein
MADNGMVVAGGNDMAVELSMFSNRMMRAAVLDPSLYEEVEADPAAGRQAALVVVLASLAAGIGAGGSHGASPQTFVVFTAIALATWMAWAWLVAEIGRRILPEPQTRTSFGELLRTIGFAAAPGWLQIFAAMPAMTVPVFGITTIWMLAAMVVAVRQSLDYRRTSRAVAVCSLALSLALAMALALGILFGPTVS